MNVVAIMIPLGQLLRGWGSVDGGYC